MEGREFRGSDWEEGGMLSSGCKINKLNIYSKNRKNTFKIDFNDLMKNNEIIQKLDQLIKDEVEQDIDGIKTLYEQLNIARQSFEEYQRKGIPISIFIDTMKFCTRFLIEYYNTYTCYRFVWGSFPLFYMIF